jgi:ankyrin repeat protein
MLLNYGSEIDACDNDGKTSLFYATQQGHLDMVKLLMCRHADLNLKSHQGVSPFRIACLQNKQNICEYLLKNANIDINDLDTDGRSTLYSLIQLPNPNVRPYFFHCLIINKILFAYLFIYFL